MHYCDHCFTLVHDTRTTCDRHDDTREAREARTFDLRVAADHADTREARDDARDYLAVLEDMRAAGLL